MSLRNFALMTALATAAAPAVAVADTAPTPAVEVVKTEKPVQTAQAEASSYAQRETQDKKVADYKGGSTVVIAISGGAFVLLLVILLLL